MAQRVRAAIDESVPGPYGVIVSVSGGTMLAKNQRRAPRVKRRMKVEFGKDDLSSSGFTQDLSIGGMLLQTQNVLPLGTRIHFHVTLPDDHFYGEGMVVRHKPVPRELRTVERPAMGIRFLAPHEVIDLAVPAGMKADTGLSVECASPSDARALVESLASGYVMVPAAGGPPSVNTVVDVKLRFTFRGSEVPMRGRVVQVLDTDGAQNAVLEVLDVAQVRSAVGTVVQ